MVFGFQKNASAVVLNSVQYSHFYKIIYSAENPFPGLLLMLLSDTPQIPKIIAVGNRREFPRDVEIFIYEHRKEHSYHNNSKLT